MAVQFVNNPKVGDNVKIEIGDSSDLQIYHDASHSYITNSTGDLTISNTGDDLILKSADDFLLYVQGTELAIQAVGNGGVVLRHNNVAKFETTSTGVTVTGGIVFGDNHFIGNGSGDNLSIQSSTGEAIVLDSSSDIVLDAAGNDISLQAAGTEFGKLSKGSGSDFVINSSIDDKDIIFTGFDNGSAITALTLDMSDGGAAEFGARLYIPEYIAHVGDSNSLFGFSGNDTFIVNTSGTTALTINSSQNAIFEGSVAINTEVQFGRELLVKGEIAALAQDSGNNQLLLSASSTQTNISATYGGTGSYAPMQFETGGAVRVHLTASGNLGIGTTSPTKKLTISDNSAQVLLIDTSSSNTLEVEVGDEIASFKLDKDGAAENSKFVWSIDDASRMELSIAEGDESQLKLNNYGSGNITGTAAYTLQVDSNGNVIEGSPSGGGTVTGSGAATRVAFWSGTSALSSDANLYWDNGNDRLGIGTTAPSLQLHIKSTSGDTRGLMIEKTVTTSYAELAVKAAREFRIGTGGSATGANAASAFYVYDATAGGTAGHRFEISSDGDVQARRPRSNTAGDVALSIQPTDSTIHYGFRIDQTTNSFNLDRSGTNLQLLRVDTSGNATFTGNVTVSGGQILTPGGINLALNPNTGVVSVGGVIRASGTGDSYFTGDLGIGITAPTSKLHVSDSSGGASIKVAGAVTDTSAYYYGFMHDASDLQGTTQVNTFYSGGAIKANTTITDYAGIRIDTPSVSATSAVVTNNYGVYQSSSLQKNYFAGNVGIGTTAPIEKLQVVGQLISTGSNSTGATSGSERAIMDLTSYSATDHSARFGHFRGTTSAGAGQLRLYTDSVERLRINASGNVGIGTTSPTGFRLVVENTSEDLLKLHNSTDGLDALITFTNPGGTLGRIQGLDNGGLGFDTGNNAGGVNTNAMVIDSSGEVGIGTTAPSAKLHVSGNTKLTSGTFQVSSDSTVSSSFTYTFRDAVGINNPNSISAQAVAGFVMSVGRSISDGVGGGIYVQGESTFVRGINAETNSTFGESVTIGSSGAGSDRILNILTGGSKSIVKLMEAGTVYGFSTLYDGATNKFHINRHSNSAAGTSVLSFNRDDDNATFAGEITVSDDLNAATKIVIGQSASPELRLKKTNAGGAKVSFYNDNSQTAYIQLDSSEDVVYYGGANVNQIFYAGGSERVRIDSSGNVGIGTTSPVNKLNVDGDIGYTGVIGQGSVYGNSGNSSYANMRLYDPATGFTTINNQSYGYYFKTTGATKVTILNNGNVGIGTTSPDARLQVDFSTYANTNAVANFINGNDPVRVAYDTVVIAQTDVASLSIVETPDGLQANEQKLTFAVGDNASIIRTANTSNGLYINVNAPTNTAAYLTGQGTTAMRFLNNGNVVVPTTNVGIGTTSPANKLNVVEGTSNWEVAEFQSSSTTGAGITLIPANINSLQWSIIGQGTSGGAGDNNLGFHLTGVGSSGGSAGYKMTIEASSGNVGIGTTNPSSLLHLSSASSPTIRIIDTTNSVTLLAFAQDSSAGFGTYSNHTLAFFSNSTERMRISTGGNVGIGTTSPAHKLSVNGTFKYGSGLEQSGAVSSGEPANPPEFTPEAWLDIKVNGSDYLIPLFEKSS